ncbi:peroxisomal membrane protein Pex17 [Cordyceps fumosorosea ARSEF 2679]|uniref:Peroxisomal membrane protein Pex17 n=1 Tax=Cordyceps fumosorosea (strain ARSEF 2679) TaxID=1081104 RepID=A0A167YH13_CORFA|nr:peroxisomal membrane protein Pex17 [Cordyceps fumosorosea ARSEF 2679]OAA66315.1 peroxisomal membrane protein Pex17 [Cordyceps fumosorosea ARSEF 2679]
MPADRLLNTLLQHYQDVHDDAKSEQILGTTVHLLTHLSNPLNLGVLTSQLLTAPAVWHRPGFDLSHALRVVSLYNSAALRVREDAAEALERKKNKNHLPPPPPPQQRESGGLKPDDWTRAVVQGADDRSPRWRHLLVLTGVLVGFESNERRTLSPSLRGTLQAAVVTAANLALQTHADDGPLAEAAVVLALNYAFPLLSEHHRARLDCGALLPVLLWAVLREEGCDDGLFLRDVARDVTHAVDGAGGRCSWPQHAPSFAALVERDRRPVMSNMGPLAKILAFAVAHAADAHVVMQAQDDLLRFSHRLLDAWAANRLSTVEPAMAAAQLDPDTLQATWPVLWQVLRKMMFAVVATLQAVMARSLLDPRMRQEAVAVDIAAKSLQILRNIYFISSVNGNDAFQVYTFTYLTSLDIICRNGAACEKFLSDCRPVAADSLTVPSAHLQRTLDLYFLNVAEHMPLALTTEAADALIIKPATSYLNFDGPMSPTMVHIFESAHSAVLSVLSCPQHGALTMQLAPFYIVRLFESFPQRMSARQFRVAFKTVMQMVSPPFPIAAQEPLLGETLLEMLLGAIAEAPTAPLAPEDAEAAQAASTESGGVLQSAQSALVLALVDALPFLPLGLVEEWMAVAARTLHAIEDPRLRRPVRERFWDILVNGEMDVERSAMGVAWWGTKGGRELVLGGGSVEVPMMSGALMPTESSKL